MKTLGVAGPWNTTGEVAPKQIPKKLLDWRDATSFPSFIGQKPKPREEP
jgi:hypothetical protein